jgi:hypothetical protein
MISSSNSHRQEQRGVTQRLENTLTATFDAATKIVYCSSRSKGRKVTSAALGQKTQSLHHIQRQPQAYISEPMEEKYVRTTQELREAVPA